MNRKQVQQLLEQLGSELREEILKSQASLKDARSITTKIGNLLTKVSNLTSKLEDPESGIDAKLAYVTEKAEVIEQSLSASANSSTIIENHLTEIQQNISNLERAYDEFEAIKAKIDDEDTGLEVVLARARQLKGQVQASATNAANLEAKIQVNLDKVQSNITTMVEAYDEFEAIKAKIDDEDTGLEAVLGEASNLKNEISAVNKDSQTLYKEISRYKDQAAKNIASIQAIKEESDSALKNIQQNEEESNSTKERISEIFELVSQSGHANYFDKRRKRLIVASWIWLVAASLALLIAVIMASKLLLPVFDNAMQSNENLTQAEFAVLILRGFIITPIIAFSIFAFTQYGKERRLAEQYAFKAVSASTIEGSIALIERSLKTVPSEHLNTQLVDFAIRTAHSLHAEPLELQKNSKFSFNAGNKMMNVGAEISETLDEIGKDVSEIAKKAERA